MMQPRANPPARAAATDPSKRDALARIRALVEAGSRFLITSHARPDGDSIGSQLALALALDRLGKAWRVVNHDRVPLQFTAFPGTDRVEVADGVEGDFDAIFVMECGDLSRPGVAGLERFRAQAIVNIDHHEGNTGYGTVNWFDGGAAACAEMVADVIDALGVPWDHAIGTHLYLAVLTDTGSFRHGPMTARTFELCRRVAEAGVDPADIWRQVYETGTIGRLRLIGELFANMRLEAGGRLAVLSMDDALIARTQANYDETDMLINMPLSSRPVQAVAMFKSVDGTGALRVSLRSKGDVDVRAIAQRYGGGGHKNAAGFTAPANDDPTRERIVADVVAALDS